MSNRKWSVPLMATNQERHLHEETAVERARARMLRDGLVANYRIEDFAACFGVSVRTTWTLIASGEVEAIKVGRRTLITANSARVWLASCPRVTPKAAKAQHNAQSTGNSI